jgi:hypothetical protein
MEAQGCYARAALAGAKQPFFLYRDFFFQVLYRGAQAAARGTSRCASQVLDRVAQFVARGAARCASQVLDRGAYMAERL